MNDSMEYWLVEQFVELGNESFFHEKARLFRHRHDTTEGMTGVCHKIGARDVLKYGGRYRIRVVKEETAFDSEVTPDCSRDPMPLGWDLDDEYGWLDAEEMH